MTKLGVDAGDDLAGGVGYERDSIAAVVIGGTSLFGGQGSLIASLIGALIIATLRNRLNVLGVYAFWQLVAIGATLIGAVHVDDWRRRRHGEPDLAGFYGACAGAGQLAKQKGRDLRSVAFDSSAEEFALFKEGPIDPLIPPDPFKMGDDGVYAMDKAPNGQQGGTRDPGAGGDRGQHGRAGDPEKLLSDMALL